MHNLPVFDFYESQQHVNASKLHPEPLNSLWIVHRFFRFLPYLLKMWFSSVQFISVTQLCLTLCDPMDCSMPGLPVNHQLLAFLTKLMSIDLVMPSNNLILCCPLLLLPSIFPSISVFSNESILCIRWPKYWSFSFSIGPSNEYSGLISFRMD